MLIHDFNRGADSIDVKVNGQEVNIRRGPVSESTRYDRFIYVSEDAGAVRVQAASVDWKTAAPFVVVQEGCSDLRLIVDGSTDNIYTLQACDLPLDVISEEKREHPSGIFLSNEVGLYTRENRFFTAGGQRRESGWYVHSLKVLPGGIRKVIGISDAKWDSGVRDGEVVHYHAKSIEPLVVLEGAAIMLVRQDGRDYSFRQTPGMLSIPVPGEVHGILEVEGPYRHMCAQAPSKFHDPTDRVVVKGFEYESGKTKEYVAAHGIPERKKFEQNGL